MDGHTGDSPSYEFGIDIGGTFTDVVCRSSDGAVRLAKIPTTRGNPSLAVLAALETARDDWGVDLARIARFTHGTTAATNAVLERKGARIGLITTQGFKDVLEIGRQMRHQMYDLVLKPETPVFLAPGRFRKEVHERISAAGEVITPLDEASVRSALAALRDQHVEAIAVCLLFAFLDPTHERRIRQIAAEMLPAVPVSLSSDVDPAFREYERTCITAFDAYIKPVVSDYLANLEAGLSRIGVRAPLQVMQSRGGLASSPVARQRPVRLFLSGPAAGVIGGLEAGLAAGFRDQITVDIGGTSCDIALISDGQPLIRPEGEIDSFTVRVPMVDVTAIGSGGGSIAWLDAAGTLRVGPQSAGSEPGPACYGRGGTLPTVTDASVVLGYIAPDRFAGGTMRLDPDAAHIAIRRHVAEPLGLTVEAAALGIHRVLNAQMAEAIRLVSIGRGIDPRGYALIPLGGAGPMHGTALAEELGIQAVIVPPHPGVLAAAGLLGAPVEHEVSAAFPRALDGLDIQEVRDGLAALDEQCSTLMRQEGVSTAEVSHYADICYIGQSYHLQVNLDATEPDALTAAYRAFQAVHDRVYGHHTANPARIVNLRTVHRMMSGRAATASSGLTVGSGGEPVQRMIRVRQSDQPVAASFWRRDDLRGPVPGPAIIEQADTTTLVEPGWTAEPGENGTLLLRPSATAVPAVAGGFDPITMEVVRHKLEGIANEMQSTLLRSSFSPIVKEGLDASAGLFTADGTTLAQACAIPIHLATLIPVLRRVIETYPPETMDPGDIFVMNDPYCGGTHLPDIAIVQPVIAGGRVLAFAAAMTHHQDMGGLTPGSVPTNATEVFQEGLRIPLLKFRDRGVINETLVAMIRQNVRIPDTVMGDIHAQVAACGIGGRRLLEIANRYGSGTLTEIFAELLDRSETMTRQALSALPEDTYRFVDSLDNDGIDIDRTIRVEVAVTIRDNAMHVDFTGTSPQVRGPLNCVPSGSLAAACFAIRALTDPSIPTNGGCFRPISLHLPPGSLVNPTEPAPVNARTSTIKRIAGSIISALASALPDRAPAASACEMLMVAFGGKAPDGKAFVIGDLVAGGSGASRFGDGVDVIETDATNCMNLPAEAMEMETPIRVNCVALAAGSGGVGEYRGGLGTVREYEMLVDGVAFTHRGERHFSRARGLAGGGDGASADGVILRTDGTRQVIPSKIVTRLNRGDRVIVQTAGGGGYGDPNHRDAGRAAQDMADGKTPAP
ncbi:MAG TPA: hydantoinase B/oxoprolinase family protein [Rhodopila sp.]|uniref:hydantoinase B/oxoprolinase family protein n=1 Tax=Rhodopila sp. TaxID=2480087 RepID=UPI002CB75765|nr:hydantoinase B/oxoprolinase family protein [Rhodopila sp.]HVY16343.1 hydantoinase B/oxoprolinase family protein [Rhodopila sp.]